MFSFAPTGSKKKVAMELAQKKLKSIKKSESDNYKISGKLYRFLISKGYNYDIVKEIVKDKMENVYKLSVPLKVDINTGVTWYDAK